MSTGWWPREIHCPNCHYEGRARLKEIGCLGWIILLALFFVSFLCWPLFIVTGLLSLYFLFKPSRLICPKCGWDTCRFSLNSPAKNLLPVCSGI